MTTTTIRIIKELRETEKAVFVETEVATAYGLRGAKVWLPKSQVELGDDASEYVVPSWLAAAKLKHYAEFAGFASNAVYRFS